MASCASSHCRISASDLRLQRIVLLRQCLSSAPLLQRSRVGERRFDLLLPRLDASRCLLRYPRGASPLRFAAQRLLPFPRAAASPAAVFVRPPSSGSGKSVPSRCASRYATILLPAAFHLDNRVAHGDHACGHAVDEVAVVAHKQHGAVKIDAARLRAPRGCPCRGGWSARRAAAAYPLTQHELQKRKPAALLPPESAETGLNASSP